MQEVLFISILVNIINGLINIYKFIDEKKKNAKRCNSKRK